MKYKESTLGRWYLKMPTLYVSTFGDGTILRHQQQTNFQVNTKGQPSRWYYEDGTLARETWCDSYGYAKRHIHYNPDGSVFRS